MNISDDGPEGGAKKGDYEVGYGRPPKATRFAPGSSGNPRRRPKAVRTFDEAIRKRLSAKVTVKENGRKKTMTLREFIAGQLIRKAAEGDLKSSALLMKTEAQAEGRGNIEGRQASADPVADDVLLRQIIASMGGSIDDLLDVSGENKHEDP